MPKKTKKEKLLAQRHRLNGQRSTPVTFSLHLSQPVKTKEALLLHSEITAIYHDLQKTILLTVCAIAIELVLYWRWELIKQ